MSRLVSTDGGRTYTWIGLSRAEVNALNLLLQQGELDFEMQAGAMLDMEKVDQDDAIADLVGSAECASVRDHAYALRTAVMNPNYVQS